MLLTDTIHHHKQPFEQVDTHCRLRIYQHNERHVVIATEMADNKEIAITNYWPDLAHEIAHQHDLDLVQTVWLEHSPQGDYVQVGEWDDIFDKLTLSDDLPQWHRIMVEEAEQLIGESL